jgi:hypothetical protein
MGFLMIRNHLAWKVGNGEKFRNDVDYVLGCGVSVSLFEEMIASLRERVICTLNQVGIKIQPMMGSGGGGMHGLLA